MKDNEKIEEDRNNTGKETDHVLGEIREMWDRQERTSQQVIEESKQIGGKQ